MDNKQKEFSDILKENKKEKIEEFLLNNSKKPKPFCPFYYIPEDERKENDNGK